MKTIDQFPFDDNKSVTEFYGEPIKNYPSILKPVVLPCNFLFGEHKTPIRVIRVHPLCRENYQFLWNKSYAKLGRKTFKELGLHITAGTWNYRKIRSREGTSKQLSTHSWGISWDIDPENNPLNGNKYNSKLSPKNKKNKFYVMSALYDFWDIVEKAGLYSLGMENGYDFMHIQAARRK